MKINSRHADSACENIGATENFIVFRVDIGESLEILVLGATHLGVHEAIGYVVPTVREENDIFFGRGAGCYVDSARDVEKSLFCAEAVLEDDLGDRINPGSNQENWKEVEESARLRYVCRIGEDVTIKTSGNGTERVDL